VIRREILLDRLFAAGPCGVTLVCAPAGSGKTVLVRSWIEAAGLEDDTGWVSVERDEHDAQRFWLAVNAALADAGGIVQRVDPAPSFRGEALVEKLLDDLRSLEEPAALVIDDLHELRSTGALRCLEDLLAAVPSDLRVFLLSREDPGLGLHRLRLTGQLTEFRGVDLRFTPEEAEALLRDSNVVLSDESARLLYERTEGWAAGLRLAAISLNHHPDPERFVTEFSGSERTVARYLLKEVLEQQPRELRQLLLRTSILDRVSGPLADCLTGGSGSERILQELEDANAFVNSLDVARSWFRYHHLFADLLQLELRRVAPETVDLLHRAAAGWHEENGDPVEAVRHAQAAHDWPHAARLLTMHHVGLILDGRLATVRELLDTFPARLGAANPELALAFADVRLRDGAAADAARYIAAAEGVATTVPVERRGAFEMHLASVKLEAASRRGDLERTREAMRALERALLTQTAGTLEHSHDIRALALMSLGIAELWALEVDDARRHLEEALVLARRIGRPYLEIGCLADLAIAAPLSELSAADALQFSEQAVAVAETHGLEADPVTALAFAVGAGSLAWLGRFDEGEQWLARAQRALRPEASPGTELATHHARGLLLFGQGRLSEALDAFASAEKVQAILSGEHALTVDLRMRMVLAQVRLGELEAAKEALRRITRDGLVRAEARIPAAAVELAHERPEPAIELLAPVIEQTAPTLHRKWAAVHALLFDALARAQLGDARAREESLERALELAEPESLILPFATAPVEDLLREHPAHRTTHATFIAEVLDVLAGGSPRRRGDDEPLLDELSEAELRVVRYLPTNLKAPEIAAELYVSNNTVRTHLRHIYAKLGAHGRAEAVARARQLRLLGPSSRVP
jgi:LuxR family transcriptional regulator, maltose regulon positive regulatory protein